MRKAYRNKLRMLQASEFCNAKNFRSTLHHDATKVKMCPIEKEMKEQEIVHSTGSPHNSTMEVTFMRALKKLLQQVHE